MSGPCARSPSWRRCRSASDRRWHRRLHDRPRRPPSRSGRAPWRRAPSLPRCSPSASRPGDWRGRRRQCRGRGCRRQARLLSMAASDAAFEYTPSPAVVDALKPNVTLNCPSRKTSGLSPDALSVTSPILMSPGERFVLGDGAQDLGIPRDRHLDAEIDRAVDEVDIPLEDRTGRHGVSSAVGRDLSTSSS